MEKHYDSGLVRILAMEPENVDNPTTATTVAEETPTVDEVRVKPRFDPMSKLIKVKGGQMYLQVRDRLIWLREDHPDARIETYLVEYYPEKEMWVVKAEISFYSNGSQAMGSGLGQETEADFHGSALEKAETKAIGRALATLGYGTQFALEMDEGNLADTPLNGKRTVAGLEDLREDVIQLLEADIDAKTRLKAAGEMTESELTKAHEWLRARALSRKIGRASCRERV